MNVSVQSHWKERALYLAGYATFFFFAFVVAAYETFPYDRLRDYLTSRLGGGESGFSVSIGELRPSWLTGVRLDDVDVVRAASDDGAPAKLHFDSVTLRASPLALLVGAQKGSLLAEVGDGVIDASYAGTEEAQQIDAELSAVDARALGLGGFLGVPLKGTANGTVNITLDRDPVKSVGDIALNIEGLRLGDGKTKVKIGGMAGGLTVDEISAGTLELAINLHDGVAEIQRFTSDGRDLKIDGTGAARLASPLRNTRLDVSLELKISDAFKNKSDRTKAMFELLNMGEWRRATGPDGTMRLHVSGAVQALRVAPGSPGRTLRATTKKRTSKAKAPAAP